MTTAAIEKNSFVVLQLGSRKFAVPADIVSELAPPVRLNAFPHRTPVVAGVIVRRGRVIPVYDVSHLLLGRASPSSRFFLVATRHFENREELSAIPVDGECELVSGELLPTPVDSPSFVTGMLAIEDDQIEVLDFENLVRGDPETNHQAMESGNREVRP